MRAIKPITPSMWINDAAKEKILSETDPETIIRNFEKYSKAKAASLDHLSDEEWCESIILLRRLTVSFIETEQGEFQPFEEAMAEIKKRIQEKYPNANLFNSNKRINAYKKICFMDHEQAKLLPMEEALTEIRKDFRMEINHVD